MPDHTTSWRTTVRTVVVAALTLFLICAVVPDVRRAWLPLGMFGYGTDLNGVVNGVDPGSPAANAGMQVGDQIDLHRTDPKYSWFIVQLANDTWPGEPVTFDLVHQGVHRTVTLVSVPDPMSASGKIVLIVSIVLAIAVAIFGAAIVLLRPSLATWGFFLYCIGGTGGLSAAVIFEQLFPYPYTYVAQFIVLLLNSAGLVGLLAFALLFLREPVGGWRRTLLSLLPLFFVLNAGTNIMEMVQTYLIGGPPGDALGRAVEILLWAASLTALFAFVDTYVRAHGTDKQRVQWIVIAFAVSLAAVSVSQFLIIEFTNIPLIWFNGIGLLTAAAPLAFAYAIVRYRVIDVNFVVSRALVYGVLTTLLVGAFSLIDWFFTSYLRLTRLGTFAEVASVLAFGLWYRALHRRVDSLVDATFFRQRHRAELLLARNAAALPFATSLQVVAHALVAEPVRALGLASAAIFRRRLDGAYVREAGDGWRSGDIAAFDQADDHLLMLLQAENGPLSLYDHPWRVEDVPTGAGRPVLAMPVIVRHEIAAVAFYGSHVHGEPLDPDEIRSIAGLATGAAAAYDHLEAEALRQEVATLRTRLGEAQIQPA
ncbi:MAG TPA: hypothetical protein VEJ20_03905 [Candidatus Eremiobacteraceae bacterium]|nr:hypothetical protein [Candidatus Eremiobacteraceae bacterium]